MMSAPEHGETLTPVSHRRIRGRVGALAATCVAALSLGSLVAAPASAIAWPCRAISTRCACWR